MTPKLAVTLHFDFSSGRSFRFLPPPSVRIGEISGFADRFVLLPRSRFGLKGRDATTDLLNHLFLGGYCPAPKLISSRAMSLWGERAKRFRDRGEDPEAGGRAARLRAFF